MCGLDAASNCMKSKEVRILIDVIKYNRGCAFSS